VPFFLGIDGGGTKTRCVIGDENSVLGEGSGSGCNIVRVGEACARDSLSSAIHEACVQAEVSPQQLARTCAGVAGAADDGVASLVQRVLIEIVGGAIEVIGDMEIALETVHPPTMTNVLDGKMTKTTVASGSPPKSKARFLLIVSVVLAMTVVSATFCRAQDAAPPSDSKNQDSNQKRSDSSTQPTGQDRMFGIMPAYGMVEAGRRVEIRQTSGRCLINPPQHPHFLSLILPVMSCTSMTNASINVWRCLESQRISASTFASA